MQMKPERRRQEKYREGNQGYGNNNSHRTAPTSSASSHTDLHQDLSRQALCAVTGTAANGVSPVPTTSVLSNFECETPAPPPPQPISFPLLGAVPTCCSTDASSGVPLGVVQSQGALLAPAMQLQMQMPQQSILLPQDRDVPIPTLPAAQLTYPVNHFVPAPPITDSFTRHEVPWNMPLDTQIQGLQEDPSREDVVACNGHSRRKRRKQAPPSEQDQYHRHLQMQLLQQQQLLLQQQKKHQKQLQEQYLRQQLQLQQQPQHQIPSIQQPPTQEQNDIQDAEVTCHQRSKPINIPQTCEASTTHDCYSDSDGHTSGTDSFSDSPEERQWFPTGHSASTASSQHTHRKYSQGNTLSTRRSSRHTFDAQSSLPSWCGQENVKRQLEDYVKVIGKPVALYQLGQLYEMRGSFDKAELCYTQSGSATAMTALGALCQRTGRPDQAALSYLAANSPLGRMRLAHLLIQENQPAEAKQLLQAINTSQSWVLLGTLYAREGDIAKTKEAFECSKSPAAMNILTALEDPNVSTDISSLYLDKLAEDAIAEMEREYSPNHPIPTLLLSVIPNTSPPPPPAISVFPRVTPRILFNQQEKCLEKPTPAPTPSSCEESPEVKKTSPPSPPSNSPFAYGRFIATATTTSTATTTAAPAVPTSASSLGGPLYETRKITFPGTEMSQENMEHYAEFMNAIQSLKITSEAEASALIAEAVGVFDTLEYDYLLQDYILEFMTELEHHHQIQKEVILDCKKVLDSLTTLHFERGSACAFTDSNRRSVLLLFNPPELKAPLQIYFCVEQAIMPWSVESLRSVVLKLVDSQGVSHFILGENADLPMMNQARPSGKVRASDTELLEVQQLFLRTYGLSEAFISHLFDLLWATVGGLHTLSETFKGFTEKARIGKEAASLFTESSSMLHNIPPQPFSPSMVEHILNQPPSKVAQKQRITRKPTELRQVTEVEEIASTSKDRPAATDISSQIPNFEFSAQVQPPICVPDTGNTLTPPPPLLVPMPPPSLLIPTTDVPTTTNGATEHPTTPQVTPGDSQPQSQQPPQPTTPITNNTQYSSQPPPLSPSTPAASIIGSLNEHTGPPLQLLPLFDQQFTDFSMVDDPVIQTEDLMLPGWWPPDV